jgi:hypothetical protein
MPMGLSTLDWLGLFVPLFVYLTLLVVYYVWEGRRERKRREQYEGVADG